MHPQVLYTRCVTD